MTEFLDYFFGVAQFVPHGMCLLWRPDLLLMHGSADFLIAAAYFTIPLVILKAMRARPDLIDRKVAIMFATFITACALTHLSGLVTLWLPYYGIQGIIKLMTAAVSVYTAYQLMKLLPVLLTMPSHEQLAMAIAQKDVEHALAEDMARRNRELDQFAYIASHDLKEPLRGIKINANFMQNEALPATATKRLDRINLLCDKMENLISDLLRLSRLSGDDRGKEPVDLAELGREWQEGMIEVLDQSGARLTVEDGMPKAKADKAKIRTVLGNLFSNALKYNESDEPELKLGFQSSVDVDGTTLTNAFYVADNGIGIEDRHQDKVFQLFSRLNSEKAYGPGTGASLAFVKRIVEDYGGELCLSSEPGNGSTFYFTLPLDQTS